MKILAAGDIHGREERIDALIYAILEHKPDLLVLAGDITTFGPAKIAVKLLKKIPIKTICVPGNCDTPEVVEVLNTGNCTSTHNKSIEVGGLRFAGFGGSQRNPPQFSTPLEYDEMEIMTCLDRIMKNGTILVTHSPPQGFLDSPDGLRHIGSEAIAKIVEKFRPPLVICAHAHQRPGIEKDGEVTIVNCSMGEGNGGAIIEIQKGKVESVKML